MAMSQIEKTFGKGAVMRMGEKSSMDIGSIPTGALALDLALGVGGLPRGRIVEVFGPESSGKSTLAMHLVAEAQRNGGTCAYIDAEHAMDPVYARAIGVNVDELLIAQPDTGEQALEIADMLIRSGALDVLVVDSVAALTPRAEIEGEMGDTHVGLQARLMSQALRKLTATLNKTDTIALFINQLREKIGIAYGNPEVTPGGRALKFYSSVRLDIRRIESIKDGVEVVGNRTRVKVVKNKCLATGTKVFDPSTGVTSRIEDVVEHDAGGSVVAVDKLGKLHTRPIVTRMDQGEAEVIGLHFRDGTELWATPDHRVLTDRGWREAGELTPGDAVARPRRIGTFGSEEPVSPGHARMLGYLIGDGYVGGETRARSSTSRRPSSRTRSRSLRPSGVLPTATASRRASPPARGSRTGCSSSSAGPAFGATWLPPSGSRLLSSPPTSPPKSSATCSSASSSPTGMSAGSRQAASAVASPPLPSSWPSRSTGCCCGGASAARSRCATRSRSGRASSRAARSRAPGRGGRSG